MQVLYIKLSDPLYDSIWGFPEMGVAGWFIMDNPTNMDDNWEYPHFGKPPHLYLYIYSIIYTVYKYVYIILSKLHDSICKFVFF
jgi:hypothetical protein